MASVVGNHRDEAGFGLDGRKGDELELARAQQVIVIAYVGAAQRLGRVLVQQFVNTVAQE
ncbi:hypothetical protein D3C77_805890 [compost metagenome]